MAKFPHPIQYQGSKRNLASAILQFLPQKIGRLVEPFAGTAAISVAAAARGRCQNFWLNDLNQPLVQLLESIVERPGEVAADYARIWNEQHRNSVEHYYQVREKFNQTQDPNLFLYLLARCVKGSVRYNRQGDFNQSPDKRRKGTRPETMQKNIEAVSALLRGKCFLTCLDYREVLAGVEPGDLVYMDPPYQGVCGTRDARYCAGIDLEGFVVALDVLNSKGILFAISYDGRRGEKTFGDDLPEKLCLQKVQIEGGRSSQATLLGKAEMTVESLYLSKALTRFLPGVANHGEGAPVIRVS